MALHQNAWSGLHIIVVGGGEGRSMAIEQAIAEIAPAQEAQLESFDNTNQAIQFCKTQKCNAFFLIHEEQKGADPWTVLKSLSQVVEDKGGLPCFAALIYDKKQTVVGQASMRFSRGRFIDYVNESDLMDKLKAPSVLMKLWNEYIVSAEELIIPTPVQRAICQLIQNEFGTQSQRVWLRLTNLLTSRLTVSWWESISIRWANHISKLKEVNPTFFDTQESLTNLIDVGLPNCEILDIQSIARSNESLPKRLVAFLTLASKIDSTEKVDKLISEIKSNSKPGSSGLLRQLAKCSDEIAQIIKEELLHGTENNNKEFNAA